MIRKWQTSRILFERILFVVVLTLPLIARYLVLEDTISIGCDTRTHVYKSYVLTQQMKLLPLNAWGSWDWTWHVGYEFLDAYSPAPYYGMSTLSILGLPLDVALKLILFITIMIGAIGTYLFVYDLTRSNILSLFSETLFLYSPIVITTLVVWGNVGKFIAYAFVPLSLYFTEKSIKAEAKIRKSTYVFLASIALSTGILSNTAIGIWGLVICALWMLIRSKASIARRIVTLAVMSSIAVLLSAFFLLPLIHARTTILPVLGPQGIFSIPFLTEMLLGGGVLHWILIAILSIKILRNRRLIDRILVAIFSFLLLYLAYNIVAMSTENLASFLSIIRGDRSLVIIVIFSAIAPAYLLKLHQRKKSVQRIIVLLFGAVVLISGIMTPSYYPMQDKKYFEASEFIRRDPSWFRYAFLPREPIAGALPQYSEKPYVDGWSFLSDPEIFSILGTPTTGFERIENLTAENGTLGVGILRYLGVKYIIVEKSDPIYGYNLSQAIYHSVKSSGLAIDKYTAGSVVVFKILGFEPVQIYDERPDYADTALDHALPPAGNLKVMQTIQNEGELRFDLAVTRAAYTVIPVVNSEKLAVYLNGEEVDAFHAYGNLVMLHLPQAGEYRISIRLKEFQPFKVAGETITFSTLLIGSIALVAISLKSKRGQNGKHG